MVQGTFNLIPAGTDFFLLEAMAAYSEAGGVNNITLSNWVRASSYGIGERTDYAVLSVVVMWGIVALRLAQPIVLLKLGANVAGAVFIVASLHVLYVRTRLLPQQVRRSGARARRRNRRRAPPPPMPRAATEAGWRG